MTELGKIFLDIGSDMTSASEAFADLSKVLSDYQKIGPTIMTDNQECSFEYVDNSITPVRDRISDLQNRIIDLEEKVLALQEQINELRARATEKTEIPNQNDDLEIFDQNVCQKDKDIFSLDRFLSQTMPFEQLDVYFKEINEW